jgi:hypothetical protein
VAKVPDGALRTNFSNFLYDLQGQSQQTFPQAYGLLRELSGSKQGGGYDSHYRRYTKGIAELNGDRDTFHGQQVRFPLQLAEVPSGGWGTEGSTWNAAAPIDTDKATATLVEFVQPIVLSIGLKRDAEDGQTSAMDAVEMYTRSAYRQAAYHENLALHGSADALICNVASNTGSGSLVVDVGTTAPWDALQPGRVVDILTRSNGADPGQGKRRKIASVSRSGGTVTFSTTAVASDGGSGNITFSSNEGIYVTGSYTAGAMAGLGAAVATTGTFEGINKANVAQWQGITQAASAVLSDTLLYDIDYKQLANGGEGFDFGIAHPKVIDPWIQSKLSMVRLDTDEVTLTSGYKGIAFTGGQKPYPMVKDIYAPRSKARFVQKNAVQLYGDAEGPSWIDDDGTMWRMFSRATLTEADLLDRVQLGVKKCNVLAELTSLTEAA